MAHNFPLPQLRDAYQSEETGFIVDGRLKYDMSILVRNKMCFFAARTDALPVPELTPNPKRIWAYLNLEQIDPPEVRICGYWKYTTSTDQGYDRWIWTPRSGG